MKILISILLLINVLFSHEIIGKVIKVSDGDTIIVLDENNNKYKIRLNDIDAPESKQAFGKKSKDNLSNLIAGKKVKIVYDKKDRYQRYLGTIYYKNKDINLQQVKDGFAWVYVQYSKKQEYYEAEKIARANKLGLWIDKNPIEPWEFRKIKK